MDVFAHVAEVGWKRTRPSRTTQESTIGPRSRWREHKVIQGEFRKHRCSPGAPHRCCHYCRQRAALAVLGKSVAPGSSLAARCRADEPAVRCVPHSKAADRHLPLRNVPPEPRPSTLASRHIGEVGGHYVPAAYRQNAGRKEVGARRSASRARRLTVARSPQRLRAQWQTQPNYQSAASALSLSQAAAFAALHSYKGGAPGSGSQWCRWASSAPHGAEAAASPRRNEYDRGSVLSKSRVDRRRRPASMMHMCPAGYSAM
jgi:hypothetical protein